MQMPVIQGKLDQPAFFIYAAADSGYFDQHARPLIRSIKANVPNLGCHIHIYNPRHDQLEFCTQHGVGHSWEHFGPDFFDSAVALWQTARSDRNERQQQMYKKGVAGGPVELRRLIANTYYACARFVRLAELLPRGQACLAIDVDGLVRRSFAIDLGGQDFYLYEKPKDGSHLAGAILLPGTTRSHDFIQQYGQQIRTNLEADNTYWFLDQWLLDRLVPQYNKGLLPMGYIDWAMRAESAIWSAKGKRKDLDIFKQEQRRYQ